jgi:hypothetical protein
LSTVITSSAPTFKNAFLKQYEKFTTFLRNELVSNNLADFRLKKGLDHLDAVRQRFQTITDRFAGFQAQWLNTFSSTPLPLSRPVAAISAPPSPHSRSLRNDNVYVFNRGPSQASAFLQQAFLLTGAGPRHVDCRKGSE